MAIKIGQIRKKRDGQIYCVDTGIKFNVSPMPTILIDEIAETAFVYSDEFKQGKSYYFTGTLRNPNSSDIKVSVILYKNENDLSRYQVVKKDIAVAANGRTNIELPFSPIADCRVIAFVIKRTSIDNPTPRDNVVISNGICGITQNLLPQDTIALRIGLQAKPNTLFIVNNEPIRLGKSGLFEINNGVKIASVGVLAPGCIDDPEDDTDTPGDAVEFFLIDYTYDEE